MLWEWKKQKRNKSPLNNPWLAVMERKSRIVGSVAQLALQASKKLRQEIEKAGRSLVNYRREHRAIISLVSFGIDF